MSTAPAKSVSRARGSHLAVRLVCCSIATGRGGATGLLVARRCAGVAADGHSGLDGTSVRAISAGALIGR
jgi:hypothetical protein